MVFLQHLPAPRLIYAAWGPSTGAGEGKEEAEEILPVPATGAHESAILELLLLYRQCCPQLLDAMEFGQEFGDLLPGVLALERDGEEAVARLQVNAVRLLLSVDNQAFAPDKVGEDLKSPTVPFVFQCQEQFSKGLNGLLFDIPFLRQRKPFLSLF